MRASVHTAILYFLPLNPVLSSSMARMYETPLVTWKILVLTCSRTELVEDAIYQEEIVMVFSRSVHSARSISWNVTTYVQYI